MGFNDGEEAMEYGGGAFWILGMRMASWMASAMYTIIQLGWRGYAEMTYGILFSIMKSKKLFLCN